MQAVNPATVRGYLQRAFKNNLGAVQSAMQQLAKAYAPEELGKKGYDLYVDFRCATSTTADPGLGLRDGPGPPHHHKAAAARVSVALRAGQPSPAALEGGVRRPSCRWITSGSWRQAHSAFCTCSRKTQEVPTGSEQRTAAQQAQQ